MHGTEIRDNFGFRDEDYTDEYFREETFSDVWENCVVLSIEAVLPTVSKFLLINITFGCILTTGRLSQTFYNILSGISGILLLCTLKTSLAKIVIFAFFGLSYLLVVASFNSKLILNYKISNVIKIITVPTLILCEYYFMGPEIWLEVRGEIMVLTMKLISISEDFTTTPKFIQYFGYMLCGGNVIFGPWMSFNDYMSFQKNPPKRSIIWVVRILQTLLYSISFLTISNCWAAYMIPEGYNKWMIAYREAFSFRTSHYFICYISEAGMISAGFFNQKSRRYLITEPTEIEFPSSLTMVVRKWNHPIHDFLKKHVFRSWLEYGKFRAVLATFVMSSLLHGLEIKITAVLVSLGIFSYLQVATRDKIANVFNCCVRIRACKNCHHKYKRNNVFVYCLLSIFSLTTILHLIYLGIIMDPSTEEIGIYDKWKSLNFLSHIMMLFNIAIILC